MYFFINNTEDGLRVRCIDDEATALAHIENIAGEDITPGYRAHFVLNIPDDYSPEEDVLIIRGEPVLPKPVKHVTTWEL